MTCTAENFPAGDSGGACPDGTMRRSTDDGRHCDGDSCDADDCCVFTCANFDGTCRARSHWRFVLPLIHLTPESRLYSAPLFLKRQCDRTPGACPEGKAPRSEDDMHECEEREGDSHDGARVRAAPEQDTTTYIGCFKDEGDNDGDGTVDCAQGAGATTHYNADGTDAGITTVGTCRDVNGQFFSMGTKSSKLICAELCSGYMYFAMQHGNECYCDNAPTLAERAPEAECK